MGCKDAKVAMRKGDCELLLSGACLRGAGKLRTEGGSGEGEEKSKKLRIGS